MKCQNLVGLYMFPLINSLIWWDIPWFWDLYEYLYESNYMDFNLLLKLHMSKMSVWTKMSMTESISTSELPNVSIMLHWLSVELIRAPSNIDSSVLTSTGATFVPLTSIPIHVDWKHGRTTREHGAWSYQVPGNFMTTCSEVVLSCWEAHAGLNTSCSPPPHTHTGSWKTCSP